MAQGGPPVKISGSLFPDGDISNPMPLNNVVFLGDGRVVYLVYRPAGREMNVVPVDGSAPPTRIVQLTSGTFVSFLVAPGEQRAVYKADLDGPMAWDIFSVPLAGGPPVQINAPGVLAGNEQIAPDGSRIVYIAQRQVYAAPITGGPSIPLGPTARTNPPVFRITPDGARVVILSDPLVSLHRELFSVPIEGGPYVQLTPPRVSGRSAVDFLIPPDGATVLFRGDHEVDNRADLFAVPILGGPITRLNRWLTWEGDVDRWMAERRRGGGPSRRRVTSQASIAPHTETAMSLTIDPWSFPDPELDPKSQGEKSIVLGGGCFWCVEAVFKQLDGVTAVRPGYAGDSAATANYKTVSGGRTNHAEVVEVVYDAARIGLGAILKVFFAIAHDPTELDRQGPDVGRQYRSAIFYEDAQQREVAEAYMKQIEKARVFDAPLATTLEPLTAFHEAEEYHHDYAARNPFQPYIRFVAQPKVEKMRSYKEHAAGKEVG